MVYKFASSNWKHPEVEVEVTRVGQRTISRKKETVPTLNSHPDYVDPDEINPSSDK
jgi:hypothetical protein